MAGSKRKLTGGEKAGIAGAVILGAVGVGVAVYESGILNPSPPSPPPPPPPAPALGSLAILTISPPSPNTTQTVTLTLEALSSSGAAFDGATGTMLDNSETLTGGEWGPTDSAGIATVNLPAFATSGPQTLQLVGSGGNIMSATVTIDVVALAPPPPPTPILTTLTTALASGQAASVTEPTTVNVLVTALSQSQQPIAANGNMLVNGAAVTSDTFATGTATGSVSVPVSIAIAGDISIQAQAVNGNGATITSNTTSVTSVSPPPPPPPPPPASPPPPPPSPPPPPTSSTGSVTVDAVNGSGVALEGYDQQLYSAPTGGTLVGSAYSPASFTGLTPGAVYYMSPNSYGSETFSHWADLAPTNEYYSSTMRPTGVIVAGEPQGYTAVYTP